jgi:cobyric acid synthase
MQTKKSNEDSAASEAQRKFEEERKTLVVQVVKLPNGATFTRLKPVVTT